MKLLSRILCFFGAHGKSELLSTVKVHDNGRWFSNVYAYRCEECGRVRTKQVYF